MEDRESDDSSYDYYCVDCKAIIDPRNEVCANCGADLSEFIEEDEELEEDAVVEDEEILTNLLPNERILFESDSQVLLLTTHRIRFEEQAWGFAQIKSIMLEELASCAMTRSSNPIFLVIAAFFFIAGVLISLNSRDAAPPLAGGIILALILVVIYVSTQKQALELASAGATISMRLDRMNLSTVRSLIDKIDSAKNERYLLGGQKNTNREPNKPKDMPNKSSAPNAR